MTNNTNLMPISEMKILAEAMAKSRFFMGVTTLEQALTLMAIAQAEGIHPAAAARDYHVIQGKPSLKADAMLSRFQSAGGKIKWNEYTDTKCSATFSHESGGEVTIEWTIEMAAKIGLAQKDNWKKYPRQMLRARVISEGIRTIYPGVITGFYTPEEVQDFSDDRKQQSKEVTIEATAKKELTQEQETAQLNYYMEAGQYSKTTPELITLYKQAEQELSKENLEKLTIAFKGFKEIINGSTGG